MITKIKGKGADFKRMFMMNRPEWGFIVLGCLASIVSGGVQPAFAIVFSKVIAVFSICDRDEQRKTIQLYCILFVVLGVLTLLSNFFQVCFLKYYDTYLYVLKLVSLKSFSFGYAGENLTKRIRSQAFKTILTQEVGWFDHPDNNVGTLTTRLAVEAAAVQGALGIRIGSALMNIANLGVGLVIAFIYGWAVALVILLFVPFLIAGGVLQTKMLTGYSSKDKEILEEAGKVFLNSSTQKEFLPIKTCFLFSDDKRSHK